MIKNESHDDDIEIVTGLPEMKKKNNNTPQQLSIQDATALIAYYDPEPPRPEPELEREPVGTMWNPLFVGDGDDFGGGLNGGALLR